jgi:hypothetical protein
LGLLAVMLIVRVAARAAGAISRNKASNRRTRARRTAEIQALFVIG